MWRLSNMNVLYLKNGTTILTKPAFIAFLCEYNKENLSLYIFQFSGKNISFHFSFFKIKEDFPLCYCNVATIRESYLNFRSFWYKIIILTLFWIFWNINSSVHGSDTIEPELDHISNRTTGSVQSSANCLNWTNGSVHGSSKMIKELDWTELWHH